MEESILTVSGLSVSYEVRGEAVEAVRGVDLQVSSGSVLAIIGASGAGKSSIALALAGLHDRDSVEVSGKVVINGRNLLDMSDKELDAIRGRSVGMIFQDSRGGLDPTTKVVSQLVDAVRRNRGVKRDVALTEAWDRLRNVGVSEELLRKAPYAHQLSSGLCQRVMIAMALAADPPLLIADEPTGSLDVTRQAQIIKLLKDCVESRKLALVFITHDLSLASVLADHVLVMRDGVLVEHGSLSRIMMSPGNEYTATMLDAWRRSLKFGEDQHASS